MLSTRSTQSTGGRRPRREQVREEVLAAAEALFLTSGYEGTTLGAVAERAGFTKGAVYSNFGGKPELFAEICRERLADEGARIVTELREVVGSASPADVASRLADALVPVVVPGDWQVVLAEFRGLARHDEALAGLYRELAREREEALATELDQGPLAGTSLEWRRSVAAIVLGLLSSLALEHRARPEDVGSTEVARELTLVLGALLAGPGR